MPRILSPYEIAWRKSAGHAVPADGVHHDEDDLEQLTAPAAEPEKPVAPPPPPAAPPTPAPKPAPPAAAGKK